MYINPEKHLRRVAFMVTYSLFITIIVNLIEIIADHCKIFLYI